MVFGKCVIFGNSTDRIKTDKYNPYPSMILMFTSDSLHPPKSRHAVHLDQPDGLCQVHISLNHSESCSI